MTTRTFEKLHGAQNDFLFLAEQGDSPAWRRKAALQLCHRTAGVGADGVVWWGYQPGSHRVEMGIWNSDGSEAATCGNALRCLGLLLMRLGLWSGDSSTPLTVHKPGPLPGAHPAFSTLLSGDLAKGEVRVDMGTARSVTAMSPLPNLRPFLGLAPTAPLTAHFVELANPHIVLHLEGHTGPFDAELATQVGRALQNDARRFFPDFQLPVSNIGLSTPGALPAQRHHIVYERGAGLTACCGSGAVAAHVAWMAAHPMENPFEQRTWAMPGGKVTTSVHMANAEGASWALQGPAEWVARGEAVVPTAL